MKKIAGFIACCILSLTAFSQKKDRSTLHIRLSDGQPLMITINDRDYKKINASITLFDLPKKRHNIRVYKYRAYADGKGGKAELVYNGRIKIEPGNTYDCIVDVNKRKFLMKAIDPSQINANVNENTATARLNSENDRAIGDISGSHSRLSRLQQDIENVKEDSKKLSIAETFVKNNSVTTYDLRLIGSWIMFDDNRLSLFKTAYPNISDKSKYPELVESFAMDEGKQEFQKFLEQKK
jgi:hypothetical protein